MRLTVPDPAAMQDLGRALAGLLRPGDLVLLSGELGAGKTTLTRGLGVGLGVRGAVTSPTFVIARVHPSLIGGPALVHVDAYRLGGGLDEMEDLDLDVSLPESVVVVEWGEGKVEDLVRAPPGGPDRAGPRRRRRGRGRPAPDGPDPRTVALTAWAAAGRASTWQATGGDAESLERSDLADIGVGSCYSEVGPGQMMRWLSGRLACLTPEAPCPSSTPRQKHRPRCAHCMAAPLPPASGLHPAGGRADRRG